MVIPVVCVACLRPVPTSLDRSTSRMWGPGGADPCWHVLRRRTEQAALAGPGCVPPAPDPTGMERRRPTRPAPQPVPDGGRWPGEEPGDPAVAHAARMRCECGSDDIDGVGAPQQQELWEKDVRTSAGCAPRSTRPRRRGAAQRADRPAPRPPPPAERARAGGAADASEVELALDRCVTGADRLHGRSVPRTQQERTQGLRLIVARVRRPGGSGAADGGRLTRIGKHDDVP